MNVWKWRQEHNQQRGVLMVGLCSPSFQQGPVSVKTFHTQFKMPLSTMILEWQPQHFYLRSFTDVKLVSFLISCYKEYGHSVNSIAPPNKISFYIAVNEVSVANRLWHWKKLKFVHIGFMLLQKKLLQILQQILWEDNSKKEKQGLEADQCGITIACPLLQDRR